MQPVSEAMAPPLQIALLGPFDVRIENKPLPPLRTRKGQWLFAMLALRHGRIVAREWLAETLWPESTESQALANLRLSLTDLRRALGEHAYRLGSPTTQTLCLDLKDAEVDLLAFEAAIQSDDPALWEQGVDTYRGELLEGCTEEWVLPERQAHEQAFLSLLERLAAREQSEGKPMAAVRHLRRALTADPFAESVHCSLMQALADAGDFASATQHYRDLRQQFHRELNAEPSPATSALFMRIQQQARSHVRAPGLSTEPSLPSAAMGYLPRPVSRFIGRENAVNTIKSYLQDTRLLTLTGMGGVGKTRLAIQAAQEVIADFPEGVWFVDLSSLSDAKVVPQSIATVLGVREQSDRTLLTSLGDHLHQKHLLLILDNCEHLLAASATVIDALLQRCASLQVLTTSRQPLGLTGEATWQVPSLALPSASSLSAASEDVVSMMLEYEAIQLFVERAMLASPTFRLYPQNVRAVAEICTRVDGVPLALELAAARVRALSVEQIAVRLEDRFHLLTGGNRTALPRQQSLRALIDWSYDLLSEAEKSLLVRLWVFAGGWTLEAVEQVCAGEGIEAWDVLDLLTALVDKSLVGYEEQTGQARYHLLETIRQYARDRLAESDAGEKWRLVHRDYFLNLAEEASRKLLGPEQGQWLRRLEVEHDNLRAVLDFCLDARDGVRTGLQLAGALQRFWMIHGHLSEGRERLSALLARPEAQEHMEERCKALNGLGSLAWMQGDYAAARARYEESLTLSRELGDKHGIAISLGNLGLIALEQREYPAARSLQEESLAIKRDLGDKHGIATSLMYLGNVAGEQGDYAAARSLYEESLTLSRELGNKQGIAVSLGNLGLIALEQSDYPVAHVLFEESLTLRRELGDKQGIAISAGNLGLVAIKQYDYPAAHAYVQECLTLNWELGNKRNTASVLDCCAVIAHRQQQPERATRLRGAACALRESMGLPVPPNAREEQEHDSASLRETLGEETFRAIWAQGQAMSPEQAVAYALENSGT
ncbi:MAG: LuxR family transcriptional regulator [Chthonomonadales bacterium]|nr:LuxR family transcriptional regulator [Chthonomonadales bacterium]